VSLGVTHMSSGKGCSSVALAKVEKSAEVPAGNLILGGSGCVPGGVSVSPTCLQAKAVHLWPWQRSKSRLKFLLVI